MHVMYNAIYTKSLQNALLERMALTASIIVVVTVRMTSYVTEKLDIVTRVVNQGTQDIFVMSVSDLIFPIIFDIFVDLCMTIVSEEYK